MRTPTAFEAPIESQSASIVRESANASSFRRVMRASSTKRLFTESCAEHREGFTFPLAWCGCFSFSHSQYSQPKSSFTAFRCVRQNYSCTAGSKAIVSCTQSGTYDRGERDICVGAKLDRVRSRLYQRRSKRVMANVSAVLETYTICTPSHSYKTKMRVTS